MTSFLFSTLLAFKLIYPTVSQLACINEYWSAKDCNNATTGCIWIGSPSSNLEGDCYPNTPGTNDCEEFYYFYECGYSLSNCCWYNFTNGEGCTADCGDTPVPTPPITPAPTFTQIGDFCYCPDAVNVTEPTAAPTQKPTKSPTTPGTKKTKDKSGSSGDCAINGIGDCCCNKDYGQQTLTFINLDDQQRTIETMRWWIDGVGDPATDAMCEFNCIEYGQSEICNISGWEGFEFYGLGGTHQRRKDGYDSFETNTWFDIEYVGGEACVSYFHTSCSSDIVGYFDAKEANVCGIKCTAWTDANPNRIGNCNNAQQSCVCAGGTLSPIPTVTSPPTKNPTQFVNSICIPTVNPTKNPTKNPIIQPTESPSDNPSASPTSTTNNPTQTPTDNTVGPTIQPSEAPTRTRAPSVPPTSFTTAPTRNPSHITGNPSSAPTSTTNNPSQAPSAYTSAPVTADPSSAPVTTTTTDPSEAPVIAPTVTIIETTESGDGPGGGKGNGANLDDGGSGSGTATIIGALIGGIVGAFICGLLCAGILFWKWKKGKAAGDTSNFKAQDEHMGVEIEQTGGYGGRNGNPLFTNKNPSFEHYS